VSALTVKRPADGLCDFRRGGYYDANAMIEDAELLHRYAQEGSEASFAELV
jgi:hypothetical protein